MAVSYSLLLTVLVCTVTAHVAVPLALACAFTSLAAAVFLGCVTAIFLLGVGVIAAISFGFSAILWTIASGPTDSSCHGKHPLPPDTGLALPFSDSERQYIVEEPEEEDRDELQDSLSKEHPPDFLVGLATGLEALANGNAGDSECASHLHSAVASSCPSGTCSSGGAVEASEDPELSFLGGRVGRRSGAGTILSASAWCNWGSPSTSQPTPRISSCHEEPTEPFVGSRNLELPHLPDELDTEAMASCQFLATLQAQGPLRHQVDLVRLPAGRGDSSPRLAARKTLWSDQELAEATFATEVAALKAAAGSPFAVRYLGSRSLEDRFELFTEYAEGGTLEQELEAAVRQRFPRGGAAAAAAATTVSAATFHPSSNRGTWSPDTDSETEPLLPPGRLRVVAASVLLALADLHVQGVVHLGVQPSHVMLSATGRALLGGMSGAVAAGSPPIAARGAPRGRRARLLEAMGDAVAPELQQTAVCNSAQQQQQVTAKADMYSVGAMVGACAFGRAMAAGGGGTASWGVAARVGSFAGADAGAGAGGTESRDRDGDVSAGASAGVLPYEDAAVSCCGRKLAGGSAQGPEHACLKKAVERDEEEEELREFVRVLTAAEPGARPDMEGVLGLPFLRGLCEEEVLL